MFNRPILKTEHQQFRVSVDRFVRSKVAPYHADWEKAGKVSRDVWTAAGDQGLLCTSLPETYGGAGADFLFATIVPEVLAYHNFSGPGFHIHSDIVAPYVHLYGSKALKEQVLPSMASGATIGAIGMSEPGAGSDLKAMSTTAVRVGDEYVINGQKVFISNGQICDLVVLAAKTDTSVGARGISLILVETNRDGVEKGRNLDKIGYKAQDTSELFFHDVRVPVGNLLGEEGQGFAQLVEQLPQERLLQAVRCIASVEAALDWTLDYTSQRKAFGRTVADFQNTRFRLAEIRAEATMVRVFVDRCIDMFMKAELSATDAAMAKMLASDFQAKALDTCLQFFGGYGYMWEFPIARAWADARMMRLAGGTSEIMREIIGRDLFSAHAAK